MSKLPSGWARADLGSLISGFETGRNFKASAAPARDSEFGVLKISAVTWGRFLPSENKALLRGDAPLPHEIVKAGNLLISRANTTELVGSAVLVDRDYPHLMLPDKILRILYDERAVERRFLLYALRTQAARAHIEKNATGTSDSMRNLSQPKLREIPVALAPLREQKRIADKLDALLARVVACRERLDRVPTILKRFRQSVLAAATSGELTTDWRDGKISSEWKRVRVDEWVTVKNGRAFPSSDYTNRGIRLLRPGNLHASGRVEWEEGNTRHLPSRYAEEYPDYVLSNSELLMNLTAQSLKDEFLGRVCLKADDAPALLNQRICAFYPIGPWDVRRYLFVYFRSPAFRKYVDTLDSGTLIKHMHSKQVLRHELFLPPRDEAEEICRRVGTLLAAAEGIERSNATLLQQTEKLPQAVLAKAFRGELVPQDPNNEPASELIARTRTSFGAEDAKERKGARAARVLERAR